MKPTKNIPLLLAILLGSLVLVQAGSNAPDQPRMHQAKADLEAARSELQKAEHNKGGHRAKAIEYVEAAITEVNRGIQFDRRNNHAQAAENLFAGAAVTPDQPHMMAALNQLNNAKRNLQEATADKGGHRGRALGFVNSALREVADGIAAGR
jgi:hypothetical protein